MNERIREVQRSAGLNQTEISEKLGISVSAYNKIVRGINNPSEQTVRAICSEFGISRRWLETGEGEMYAQGEGYTPREVQMMLRGSFTDEQIAWVVTMLQQPVEVLQGMAKMLRDYEEQMSKIKKDRE